MLQAPFDKILVEVTSRYDDEITFASGVKLYVDPTFNPNFHATSVGVVHSVPRSLRNSNKAIEAIIRPGDEVLFSYKTVGDVTYEENTTSFRMTTKDEGYVTEWMNQDRDTIRMEKGLKDGQWAVVYINKWGHLLAGKVGSQGECENWIAANFKFADGEGFTYDNQCIYKGKELWQVDYSYVFAIRRKGHIRMVGDYLLVEPLVENRPLKILHTNLERTEADRHCLREDKGWLKAGGKGKEGFQNGDLLVFQPNMKEKYNIFGKPMYIVRKEYVLGKELPTLIDTNLN